MQHKILPLRASILPLAIVSALIWGCGDEDGVTFPEGDLTASLSLSGLEPLPGALNYQAWLVAGTPDDFWGYPLVLFDVDQEGRMVDPVEDTLLAGPFPAGLDPASVLGVAVSLEASDTLRAYSSYTFVLGGDALEGTAQLSTDHWIALGGALTGAGGRYVLTTPTTETSEDDLSGIWFMDSTDDPVTPGLEVPEATLGWNYEGWLTLGEETLSMGRFPDPSQADSSALYSGALTPPPFPGEDFVSGAPEGLGFPADLAGASLRITLEPWAEWDVEPQLPFFLEILEAEIPPDPTPNTPYPMTPLLEGLPTGTATITGTGS